MSETPVKTTTKETESETQTLNYLWKLFNKNETGTLDKNETNKFVKLCVFKFDEKVDDPTKDPEKVCPGFVVAFDALFTKMDTDKSEGIERKEVLNFLRVFG